MPKSDPAITSYSESGEQERTLSHLAAPIPRWVSTGGSISVAARIASGSAYAYIKTVPMRQEPRSVDRCSYRVAGTAQEDDDFTMVRFGEGNVDIEGSVAGEGGVVKSISCNVVGTAARIIFGVSGSRRWLNVPLRDCNEWCISIRGRNSRAVRKRMKRSIVLLQPLS